MISNPILKWAISCATEGPRPELAQVLSFQATGTPTFLENNVVSSPAKKQRTLVFLDLKHTAQGWFGNSTILPFLFFELCSIVPTDILGHQSPARQLWNWWLMFWMTTADFGLFTGVWGGLSGPKGSCFSKLQSSLGWEAPDSGQHVLGHCLWSSDLESSSVLSPRAALPQSCLRTSSSSPISPSQKLQS